MSSAQRPAQRRRVRRARRHTGRLKGLLVAAAAATGATSPADAGTYSVWYCFDANDKPPSAPSATGTVRTRARRETAWTVIPPVEFQALHALQTSRAQAA